MFIKVRTELIIRGRRRLYINLGASDTSVSEWANATTPNVNKSMSVITTPPIWRGTLCMYLELHIIGLQCVLCGTYN